MVSRTKRGVAFLSLFEDFVGLVKGLPGVAGIVGDESPGPEIVVFIDELDIEADEELGDRISDATVEVLNLHLDIDVEFHVRTLRNMELQDFDLAGCDLVYARDNGQQGRPPRRSC